MDIKLMISSEICKNKGNKRERKEKEKCLSLNFIVTETYRKVVNRISAFLHVVSLF